MLLFDWTKSWMCFSFEKQNFTFTTFFDNDKIDTMIR